MKLKDLIIELEEMNCVEQTIETKGELVNWECDDYNLPVYNETNSTQYERKNNF